MDIGVNHIKNLIAIGAGKGGVGKSTITVNLAIKLNQMGFKVGILDLDLYGPSIGKMMIANEIPTPYLGGMLPASCGQIKLMSIAYFQMGLEVNFVRAPIANGILKQFLHQVYWGELDYLLIDLPPGTSDIHMTLMQEVDLKGAILVTTPQEVSLLDVRKALLMYFKMNVPIIGVIENMSYFLNEGKKIFPFGDSKLPTLTAEYVIDVLGYIPIDPLISDQCDKGFSEADFYQLHPMFEDISNQILKKVSGMQNIPKLNLEWNKSWV